MFIIIIGILSGIISGMGIGGGTILIPALFFLTTLTQQQSQGINLIAFIPISIIALIIHIKNKNIEKKIILPLIVGGIIGALIGASLAIKLPSTLLKRIFGIFLLCIGLYELFNKNKKSKNPNHKK